MTLTHSLAFSVQREESSSPTDFGDINPLVPELHPMSLLRSDLAYRHFTPSTPQHVQCVEMACSASSCDRRVG